MLRKLILGAIFGLISVSAVAQGINNPGPVNINTGVSGLGSNVATFLSTPSSANLASAVTDETGTGPLVFQAAPTLTGVTKFGAVGDQGFVRIWSSSASGTGSYTTISSDNTNLGRMVLTGGGGSASTVSEIGISGALLPTTDNNRALGSASTRWATADIVALNISGATQTFSNAAFTTCTGLTTVANVLTCTVSDERVKDKISEYNDGLSFIRGISPTVFKFKKNTPYYDGRNRLGLIAQNVQKANPLSVIPTGNGYLQVDYDSVTAATVSAVKELDKEVKILKLISLFLFLMFALMLVLSFKKSK